jgi:molybdopterin-guanine dinucleotide biosynthesis protein A
MGRSSDDPNADVASSADAPLRLEDVTAAVLCGGRSKRFGADKALHVVGGRTLLDRVLESLAPARERLLVGKPYPLEGVRFVPDLREGRGPLGGLETALEAAADGWLALAACDLPCLSVGYWRLLCTRARDGRAVVVRGPQGRLEPLAALYPTTALREARARLDGGLLDMQGLLRALEPIEIPRTEVEAHCGPTVLRNVNRPDDLQGGADPCTP